MIIIISYYEILLVLIVNNFPLRVVVSARESAAIVEELLRAGQPVS